MPIAAEVIHGKPKLPRVGRKSRVYRAPEHSFMARSIGTLQATDEGGHVAHVVVPVRGENGTQKQLVQLTAGADTPREVIEAEMRALQIPLPEPQPRVVKARYGLVPWRREVGQVSERQDLVVQPDTHTLVRQATVRAALKDQTLYLQRTQRVVPVHIFDGQSAPTVSVRDTKAQVVQEMGQIHSEQYRITGGDKISYINSAGEVIAEIREGTETWISFDGKRRNNSREILAAYIVNDEGRLVRLSDEQEQGIRRVETRFNNYGRRRPSWVVDEEKEAAIAELEAYILNNVPERVEVPGVLQAGAMDQGNVRKTQQDAIGYNGKIELGSIGGTKDEKIQALAALLVPADASNEVVDAKILEINRLEQDVHTLIDAGKILGLSVAADGMGGGLGGQVASSIFVYAFQRGVVDRLQTSSTTNIELIAREAAEEANRFVYDYGSTFNLDSDNDAMRPQTAFAASVVGPDNKTTVLKDGDGHIYLEENGVKGIRRILADNSLAQMRLEGRDADFYGHQLTFSEIYTPADPNDKQMSAVRSRVTHMVGSERVLGAHLHITTFELPYGGRLYLTTDGVTEGYDNAAKKNRSIIQGVDSSIRKRVARGMSLVDAIDLGHGEIFEKITLARVRAPRENIQQVAQELVKNRPNASDNGGVVVVEVPALVSA